MLEPEGVVAPTPSDYVLRWQAPESCPGKEVIEQRIAALRLDPQGAGTMQVDATVSRATAGYTLQLVTSFAGTVDSRTVTEPTCDQLANATALVVAVALVPSFGGDIASGPAPLLPEAPPPGDAPATARTMLPATTATEEARLPAADPTSARASASATSSAAPRSEPAPPRRPPPAFGVRVVAGPESGSLPGVAVTSGITFGLWWPRARLEIGGRWIGVRRRQGPQDASARVQLGTASARGCWVPHMGRWSSPLCAGVEAGAVRVDRRGFTTSGPAHGPWLAPLVSAGAVVRLARRVGLGLQLEAAIKGLGTRITSEGTALFAPAPVSARGLVGLEFSFP